MLYDAKESPYRATKVRGVPLSNSTMKFLAEPPADSRTRAALDFGIDISLTTRRLIMSPDERVADLGMKMDWLKALRQARRV